MHPELLRFHLLGELRVVHTFPLVLGLAAVLGIALAVRLGRRDGLARWDTASVGLLAVAGGLAGAVLLELAVNLPLYLREPAPPGLTFYGGLLGGAAGALLFVWRYGLPLGAVGDAAAPSLALAHALGRCGCFLAGCCFGRPARPPWPGVLFRHPVAPATVLGGGVPLHPVQLYEAAGLLLLGAALLLARRSPRLRGRLLALHLAGYALLRLGTEALRGDPLRGSLGGLSTSQLIALATLLAAPLLWRALGRLAAQNSRG